MARRVTPSQLNSILRQEEARQRREINRYNAAVRQENSRRKRAVDDYNREARAQKRKIDDYNRQVSRHNGRVQAERRRLATEIRRLDARHAGGTYIEVQASTRSLQRVYLEVDGAASDQTWGASSDGVAALAGAEAANSTAVANALLGDAGDEGPRGVQETAITDELIVVSDDLDKRWKGALYALDPRNPDAARHFCTSSREILISIIDTYAPDSEVLDAIPDCATAPDGRPARRAKISYLLESSGLAHESLAHFVDVDVDDVVGLFRVFNDGTHGSAGRLDMPTLRSLQRRVEGAITFVSALTRPR